MGQELLIFIHFIWSRSSVFVIDTLAPQTIERLVEQSGQVREVAAFDIQDLVELLPFVESRFLGEQLLKFPLEKVTSDILAQAAPFLYKEHIDLLVDRLLASDQAMCLDQLSTLAPFIGREKMNQLVDIFVESGQEVDLEYLCSLAPFVSQTKLDRLDSLKSKRILVSLAPFIDPRVLQFLLTHGSNEA